MQSSFTLRMIARQRYFFLALCYIQHAICFVASPQPSLAFSTNSNHHPKLSNISLGVPIPPPDFDVNIEIGGPKLRQTPCLLNVVDALRQLALGDFDAKVIDGTEYRLDTYPEVSILVNTPKRKRNIQAKFIIWAIFLGVEAMIKRQKWELAQVGLSWNDEVFGWVHITNDPSPPGLRLSGSHVNDTMDVAKRSLSLRQSLDRPDSDSSDITNTVMKRADNDPDEARLTTTFVPRGQNIAIYDIFFVVTNALTDMANKKNWLVSDGLVASYEGANMAICILPKIPLRTSPPLMDYGWLIRAIARIPAWMVEQRRFGEIDLMMTVDGVNIAYGKLSSGVCD